ncbi:hypothetical protein [Emticicia agri]|uniref:Uncharacterized protein n=1 Tax=Emticicia agri TaxID=2492393 RepID=A0A4Q5M598_9BACT|nr:hypothetical protein [Emticicia agri]RYU97676.1 hypothetical protein EWM59_00710 [Emticicia agri]
MAELQLFIYIFVLISFSKENTMLVLKKKIALKVYFLLILMFCFICRQFISEGIRIYELAVNNTEQCLDISLEDNCSLETQVFGAEEVEACVGSNLFRPVMIEFTHSKEAIFSASNIHEVYLGLNTPPPEQMRLLA